MKSSRFSIPIIDLSQIYTNLHKCKYIVRTWSTTYSLHNQTTWWMSRKYQLLVFCSINQHRYHLASIIINLHQFESISINQNQSTSMSINKHQSESISINLKHQSTAICINQHQSASIIINQNQSDSKGVPGWPIYTTMNTLIPYSYLKCWQVVLVVPLQEMRRECPCSIPSRMASDEINK